MEKNDLLKAVIAAMLAFVLWNLLSNSFFKPPPPPQPTPLGPIAAGVTADTRPSVSGNGGVRGAALEEFIELGNVDGTEVSPYPLGLRFNNRGASLESAHLTGHAAEVGQPERYELLRVVEPEGGPALYSFTTESININCAGRESEHFELAGILWHSRLEDINGGQRAVFWLDFYHEEEEQPYARLTKTYTLYRQTEESGHQDMDLSLELENLGDSPLKFNLAQLGPVGVPQEDPRFDQRKIVAGVYDGTTIALVPYGNSSISPDTETPLVKNADASRRLDWASGANKFFAVIAAPRLDAGEQSWITNAEAVRLSGVDDEEDDATFRLVTAELVVQPGASSVKTFDCYLGPKSKNLFLNDPIYAKRQYVLLINDDYYWCAWAPIVNIMLWLLDTSYRVIPNYGLAIIMLVVVVRTLLHPLTKKGQVNMTRMASQMALLQPKMEEIRKRYANDKTKLNQETMKLYQQEGVNPAGQMLTCLPMMCQMPVWGGLWAALSFTVEMRHQPFCLWIKDLTAPDALFQWAEPLPLIGTTFNLLPLLLGLSMFLQQRFMPKPAAATKQDGKSSDQMAQQRMMMYFMSVVMVFMFYSAPSGLSLYIMASNFFGLLEQHFIRKHIKEQEEREGAAGKPLQHKSDKPGGRKFKKPGFLVKLEKMAEDAKKK